MPEHDTQPTADEREAQLAAREAALAAREAELAEREALHSGAMPGPGCCPNDADSAKIFLGYAVCRRSPLRGSLRQIPQRCSHAWCLYRQADLPRC